MAEAYWQPSAELAAALHPSTSREYVLPRRDLVLFTSDRFSATDGGESVLNNFLKISRHHLPKKSYFETVQTEVTAPMRDTVTHWMKDVCDEEQCSCEVFPLAVSYLDRFLSVEAIHKHQLQALATACLFLASKVKEARHIDGPRLVQYTDDSVPISELLSWELLVLNRLDWDLASLTAFDFIDQYMHQLRLSDEEIAALRLSLNSLVAKMAIDFRVAVLPPSLIAALCLHLASGKVFGKDHPSFQKISVSLEKIMALVVAP